MEEKVLQNYIAGKWVDGDERTAVYNPANGEEIAQVPLSDKTAVDEAVKAAKLAQKNGRSSQRHNEPKFSTGSVHL